MSVMFLLLKRQFRRLPEQSCVEKTRFIARDLQLTDDQFNAFVECRLSGTEYYGISHAKGTQGKPD